MIVVSNTTPLNYLRTRVHSILVLTGSTRREDLARYPYRPTLVADSIARLDAGSLAGALLRETGRQVTGEEAARLQRRHAEAYARQVAQVRPLPGARELLDYLSQA